MERNRDIRLCVQILYMHDAAVEIYGGHLMFEEQLDIHRIRGQVQEVFIQNGAVNRLDGLSSESVCLERRTKKHIVLL